VVLQAGRDLLEASRRHNVRSAVTSLLMLGADGDWVEVADDTALGRRRRRVEGAASQGSLSGGALRAYGRAKLATAAAAQVERVHKLVIVDDSPLPVRDFGVGDMVWSDSDGGRRRLRVAQWTLTLDDQGIVGVGQPRRPDRRPAAAAGPQTARHRRRIQRHRHERWLKTVEGLTPATPTGLTVQSVTSARADGASESTLLAAWDPVVTASTARPGSTSPGTGCAGGMRPPPRPVCRWRGVDRRRRDRRHRRAG
jgi:hypothetical protein